MKNTMKAKIILGLSVVVLISSCTFFCYSYVQSKDKEIELLKSENDELKKQVSAYKFSEEKKLDEVIKNRAEAEKTVSEFIKDYYTYKNFGDNKEKVLSYLKGEFKEKEKQKFEKLISESEDLPELNEKIDKVNYYWETANNKSFSVLVHTFYKFDTDAEPNEHNHRQGVGDQYLLIQGSNNNGIIQIERYDPLTIYSSDQAEP